MSDSEPPDSGDLPWTSESVTSRFDPFAPEPPRFIPVARPVMPFPPGQEVAAVPHLRARRVVFELLMLVPIGFVGAVVGYAVGHLLGMRDEKWLVVASTVGMGVASACTAALFVFIDGQRAESIGWTGKNLLVEIGVGLLAMATTYMSVAAIVFAAALLFPAILDQEPEAQRAVRERMPDMSLAHMVLLMGFVAVWEEIVFRGFLLTRLHSLLRRWWLAVPISAIIFGSVHFYEGPLAVVVVTVLGVVMALLFIQRRSLVPCITMHFVNNVVMLLLMRLGE